MSLMKFQKFAILNCRMDRGIRSFVASIPHLLLGSLSQDDLSKIVDEVNKNVFSFSDVEINSELAGPEDEANFKASWGARGLVDYSVDSKKIYTYQRAIQLQGERPGGLETFRTELLERLPRVQKLLGELTVNPITARLFVIYGNSKLPWHNHCPHVGSPEQYDQIVIQVPLVNSLDSIYEVRKRDSDIVSSKVYLPGEVWIFNSYHSHRVVNQSSMQRLTLFIITRISDLNGKYDLEQKCKKYLAGNNIAF
jgi:hypothetical protein